MNRKIADVLALQPDENDVPVFDSGGGTALAVAPANTRRLSAAQIFHRTRRTIIHSTPTVQSHSDVAGHRTVDVFDEAVESVLKRTEP